MGFYASSVRTRVVNSDSTNIFGRIENLLGSREPEGVNRWNVISFAYSIAYADSFDSDVLEE